MQCRFSVSVLLKTHAGICPVHSLADLPCQKFSKYLFLPYLLTILCDTASVAPEFHKYAFWDLKRNTDLEIPFAVRYESAAFPSYPYLPDFCLYNKPHHLSASPSRQAVCRWWISRILILLQAPAFLLS